MLSPLRLSWSLLILSAAVVACTPDVATDPLPGVAEFDPGAQPPRAPEPSFLLIDPTTGRINLARAGITVPADCQMSSALPVAQCEFFQYLQTLDGFPTTARARAPLTGTPDEATLRLPSAAMPGNVVVIEQNGGGLRSDLTVSTVPQDDEGRALLEIAPRPHWTVGSFVIAGLRGYANGVRVGGQPLVASVPFALVRGEQPLTCGAATAAEIAETCPFFQLLSRSQPPEMARASLVALEGLRQALRARGVFTALAAMGSLPPAETAIAWGFPVHTASVIELDPTTATLTPMRVSPTELRVAVNGTLDPATLRPFTPGQQGTVLLLDLVALAMNDLPNALVPITPAFENGQLVIRTGAPFMAGRRYGLFVSTGVTNDRGVAIVPSPITVALRSRGPLLMGNISQVTALTATQALLLETARLQLAALFDDPRWAPLTGLSRAQLAFIYAFDVQ